MWNKKRQMPQDDDEEDDDDDSNWQVRAFEEDTAAANLKGCTWPPRSYTCTFCRKEFHSAQALGGHMNVHRRDRARLHEVPTSQSAPNRIKPQPPSTCVMMTSTQEVLLANGLCLVCSSLPNKYAHVPDELLLTNGTMDSHSTNTTPSAVSISNIDNNIQCNKDSAAFDEELDLELRLGSKSSAPPTQGR